MCFTVAVPTTTALPLRLRCVCVCGFIILDCRFTFCPLPQLYFIPFPPRLFTFTVPHPHRLPVCGCLLGSVTPRTLPLRFGCCYGTPFTFARLFLNVRYYVTWTRYTGYILPFTAISHTFWFLRFWFAVPHRCRLFARTLLRVTRLPWDVTIHTLVTLRCTHRVTGYGYLVLHIHTLRPVLRVLRSLGSTQFTVGSLPPFAFVRAPLRFCVRLRYSSRTPRTTPARTRFTATPVYRLRHFFTVLPRWDCHFVRTAVAVVAGCCCLTHTRLLFPGWTRCSLCYYHHTFVWTFIYLRAGLILTLLVTHTLRLSPIHFGFLPYVVPRSRCHLYGLRVRRPGLLPHLGFTPHALRSRFCVVCVLLRDLTTPLPRLLHTVAFYGTLHPFASRLPFAFGCCGHTQRTRCAVAPVLRRVIYDGSRSSLFLLTLRLPLRLPTFYHGWIRCSCVMRVRVRVLVIVVTVTDRLFYTLHGTHFAVWLFYT